MLSVNTIIQKRWQKEDITEDSMAVSISKDYSLSKGLDVAAKVRHSCVVGKVLDIGKK